MVFHLHKANRPPPHRPAALAASPGLHCSRQRRHSLSTSLASCLVAPDWNSYLEEFNGRLVDKWFLVVKGKSLRNTYLNIWRPGGGWATVGVVRHKARSLCNHFTKFFFDFLLWVFSVYFPLILFTPTAIDSRHEHTQFLQGSKFCSSSHTGRFLLPLLLSHRSYRNVALCVTSL